MKRTRGRIGSRLWLLLFMVFRMTAGAAHAASPPEDPAANPQAAPASLEQAIFRCRPGAHFTDCTESLRGAHCSVQVKAGSRLYGVEVARIDLQEPYLRLEVATQANANQQVVRAAIYLDGRASELRRSLLQWLKQSLPEARLGVAYGAGPALGCGSRGAGFAWFDGDAVQPQVQYAVMTMPLLARFNANAHRREDLLLRGSTDELALCFLLPQAPSGSGYVQQIRYGDMMARLARARHLPTLACK